MRSLKSLSRAESVAPRKDSSESASDELDGDDKRDAAAAPSRRTKVIYLGVVMITHTALGCLPFCLRYLQVESGMDALIIGTLTAMAPSFILGTLFIRKETIMKLLRVKRVWIFLIFAPVFPICSTYANRLTLSVFYQLILLLNPVATSIVFKLTMKRALPRFTIPVIVVSFAGAFLALLSNLIDPSTTSREFTSDDAIGVTLAFAFVVTQSCYFVFLGTIDLDVPKEGVFWTVTTIQLFFLTPITFSIDDWTVFARLETLDWVVLCIYVFGIFLLAPLFQLQAIRIVGAPTAATLLPWRMVPALLLGVFLLEEELSVLNFTGIAIVFLSTSFYVWSRFREFQSASASGGAKGGRFGAKSVEAADADGGAAGDRLSESDSTQSKRSSFSIASDHHVPFFDGPDSLATDSVYSRSSSQVPRVVNVRSFEDDPLLRDSDISGSTSWSQDYRSMRMPEKSTRIQPVV